MRLANTLVFSLLFLFTTAFGQSRSFTIPSDRSLENLRKLPDDTTKVLILNRIGWDTAYYNLAIGLEYATEALRIAKAINYEIGITLACNTLGATYCDMGNFDDALTAHMEGLRHAEKMGDPSRIGTAKMNISIVYNSMGDSAKATQFLEEAIVQYELSGYERGISVCYINLGGQYYETHRPAESRKCYRKSLEIGRKQKYAQVIAHSLIGLAIGVADSGDFVLAHQYMDEAFVIIDSLEDPYELAQVMSNAAQIYTMEKNYAKAEEYSREALKIFKEIGVREEIRNLYGELSELCEKTGRPEEALKYWKDFMVMKDSLVNEEVLNHQRNLEALYESEKKKQEIELLTRKGNVRQWFLVAIAACFIILVFLVVMLYKRNQFRKQTNIETERRNVEIESINQNITDSINYASRIQEAVIPSVEQMQNEFADAFVLSKPKDIVSGDFWWCTKQNDSFFLAVADSTGHGVPGGFMSMLGSVFLFEIINEQQISSPANILNLLRTKVISALSKSGTNSGMKDGMDMVMCRFSNQNRKLEFACAMNPVWVVRNKSIIEFRADKFPVGEYLGDVREFTLQSFDTEPGDMIYLFSDGYADQFGGAAGKKMKYRTLRDIFIEVSSLPCEKQKEILNKRFEDWKGSHEQVDDVIITGIRI